MSSNAIKNGSHDISIVRGRVDDGPAVLNLLDTAVAWLASQDRTGQWGASSFSQNPKRVEQITEFATSGHGIWLAIKNTTDTHTEDQNELHVAQPQIINERSSGSVIGALAIGDRSDYVAPVSEPELYIRLLVTDRQCAGHGIGKRLLDHARELANRAGISLLRVDCYAGDDGKLVKYYEPQGFERVESSTMNGDWPCQVLAQRLNHE